MFTDEDRRQTHCTNENANYIRHKQICSTVIDQLVAEGNTWKHH